MFKTNESTADRIFRIILGLVLLSLVFFGPKTNWGYIGIVPLLVGVVGICPVYRLLGINNAHKRELCD
ncbi:YgaP family membrane protein [Sneathiella glossodoripedis]|uniref:YgaP family membrane protein n=1 Tax=Sneathiella glossodoripedis TaxID=418853 RepID=UPI0004708B77|nr:DUF2892 domain-containing protein [Sneathiella glossodoripedis]